MPHWLWSVCCWLYWWHAQRIESATLALGGDVSRQETPRFISITLAILGPVVVAINSGMIPKPSGVYPPTDYNDMAIAAMLTLAGWALEGPPLARWVKRQLDKEAV